jgi:hypothetical protein
MPYFLIDPDERLDGASCLAEAGSQPDTITISSFSIAPSDGGSPGGPLLSGEGSSPTATTVFVSNCRAGAIYRLSNRIVTGAGRIAERSISIRAEQQ